MGLDAAIAVHGHESERAASSPALDLHQRAIGDAAYLAAVACGAPFGLVVAPGFEAVFDRSGDAVPLFGPADYRALQDFARQAGDIFEFSSLPGEHRLPQTSSVALRWYAGLPVVGPDGEVLGTLAVVDLEPRQLTAEQRAALCALSRTLAATLLMSTHLALTRAMIDGAPVALYHADTAGRILYGNSAHRRLTGLRVGGSLRDRAGSVHADDRERAEHWADFNRNPRPETIEYRTPPREGASSVLLEQVVQVRGVPGYVGTVSDAAASPEARDAQRSGDSRFRGTFDQAPIGIAYADHDGRLLRCNAAFADLLGRSASSIAQLTTRDFTFGPDQELASAEAERLWRGEVEYLTLEARYLRADQSTVWVRVTARLVRDGSGVPTCSVGFVENISARKLVEAELRKNQRLLAGVINAAPVAIRACDVDGKVLLFNRAAEDFFSSVGAERFVSESSWSAGNAVAVFLSDGKTPVADEDRPLEMALRGATVTGAEYVVAPSSGPARKMVVSTRQLVDDDGECLGAVAVTQDVTQQRALERELIHSQKLESIGQLAAGIAHEINTPTQFIGDNVRFLDESFREILAVIGHLIALAADRGDDPVPTSTVRELLNGQEVSYLREEVPKAIEQSLEGIGRIVAIVGAMKEFSHPGLEKTPVDVNRAIATTITVASNEWKYVAEIATDLDPTLPTVQVIPGSFNQVILNMIVNAAHALADNGSQDGRRKGRIEVSTRRGGDWVEIRISDNGCGMSPSTRDRIFDPFFTTKPIGKGTGQGLAIAHDVVVNKHGGTITVDSEPGVGTTFAVRLPLGPAAD